MRVNWREMRAVLAALAANLGIAITKFIAFLVSGSTSMLAEAVHSVADTGNQVLLLIGRGRADRPASDEHPFGFGRERRHHRPHLAPVDPHSRHSIRVRRSRIATVWPGSIPDAMAR